MIYFDNNATTAVDDRVLEAMLPFFSTYYGNASSLYKAGRLTRSAIATAREQVSALVGVSPAQVIFTSGGTEANALALNVHTQNTRIAISAIEHPSISETALRLKKQGCRVDIIPVDSNGLILENSLETLQISSPAFVSIMLANNETGCIQAIQKQTDKLRPANLILHTDAVQALGKMPVDFKKLGVQRMSISSHKIYGPKGCGALIVDNNTQIEPMLIGGDQEKGLRAGTENVAAIVGFGKAAELAMAELSSRTEKLLALRLKLEHALMEIPHLTIFAQQVPRLPNTVQFGVAGIDGEMLLMQLDQKNIAVSSGSACASEGGEPSHVLMAMGIPPSLAKSAIRVSLGKQNTETEINQFITTLKALLLKNNLR
jgi:cysteine desulfurase